MARRSEVSVAEEAPFQQPPDGPETPLVDESVLEQHPLAPCHIGAYVHRCYGAALLAQSSGPSELPREDVCYRLLTDGCKVIKRDENKFEGSVLFGDGRRESFFEETVEATVALMSAALIGK